MMKTAITREQAYALLRKYNQDPFHLRHGRTVEEDFEMYPEQHCIKSQELMREAGLEEKLIHATASHGYGQVCDIKPEHQMEKVLFACDELTGLIWAAALMRPSKSTQDMELKSLKKKFKDKRFAAGCSRETIQQGADMLGWTLDELLERTLQAMQQSEEALNAEFGQR